MWVVWCMSKMLSVKRWDGEACCLVITWQTDRRTDRKTLPTQRFVLKPDTLQSKVAMRWRGRLGLHRLPRTGLTTNVRSFTTRRVNTPYGWMVKSYVLAKVTIWLLHFLLPTCKHRFLSRVCSTTTSVWLWRQILCVSISMANRLLPWKMKVTTLDILKKELPHWGTCRRRRLSVVMAF